MTTLALPQIDGRNHLTHSSESTFKNCPRKFWLCYELGLRPKHSAQPLRLGNAVHAGLEVLKGGGDEASADLAIRGLYADAECPPYLEADEFAVEEETAVALVKGYARRYADDLICEYVAVEQSFDLPIINPETGRQTPIFRSAGKIDGIVRLPDGRLAVMEHKTASEDLGLDSDYWRRLAMDSQISRYVMAAGDLGYDIATTIYDVIRKPEIRPKNITKADRALATSRGDYFGLVLHEACPERETPAMYGARLLSDTIVRPDFYFARNEVPRLSSDLEEFRWEQWAIQRAIQEARRFGRWYRNTAHCTQYGKCPYFDVCRGALGDPANEIPQGFRRVAVLHEELTGERS